MQFDCGEYFIMYAYIKFQVVYLKICTILTVNYTLSEAWDWDGKAHITFLRLEPLRNIMWWHQHCRSDIVHFLFFLSLTYICIYST